MSILSEMCLPAPRAISVGQMMSTSRGRCGPCCSTAPHGTTHTLPISIASLISGQVNFSYRYSFSARLVMVFPCHCLTTPPPALPGTCDEVHLGYRNVHL